MPAFGDQTLIFVIPWSSNLVSPGLASTCRESRREACRGVPSRFRWLDDQILGSKYWRRPCTIAIFHY